MTSDKRTEEVDVAAEPVVECSLLGMGNPLLDIAANVDEAFLKKYELDANNQILCDDKHKPMYDEMAAMEGAQFIPGGATLNSMRVATWMGSRASYIGSIADDKFGGKMQEICKGDNVNAVFQIGGENPTGTCAVAITGHHRSLVANLASANDVTLAHTKKNMNVVEQAKVYYSAGFFVTHEGGQQSSDLVSKHAVENEKTYCMNLSAPFLMEVPIFKPHLMTLFSRARYVFGNEVEAVTFAKCQEGDDWKKEWTVADVPEIAKKMAEMEGEVSRTVVITNGADPTVVAIKGQEVQTFPVDKLEKEQIVDTNGAGDGFVGGFLAGLVRGAALEKCVAAGHFGAATIIQASCCMLPSEACTFAF